ncbi:MAG: type II secretion system F family protein [Slackia sp.]|nr:type II secretion system F family protein [Slackia sp.]
MVVFIGLCAAVAGVFASMWASELLSEKRKEQEIRRKTFGANDAMRRKGAFFGIAAPWSKRKQRAKDSMAIERHVPEMIDAVALGMRAGLSFESAFSLYCARFDDDLATACRRACRSWESGMVSRDEALRALARDMDIASLTRFMNGVIRCLRFGSPMSRMFEAMAGEARSCYRAKMEELVAKAPVKMLVPTAGLILPAMLIMVLGPVLLEFL